VLGEGHDCRGDEVGRRRRLAQLDRPEPLDADAEVGGELGAIDARRLAQSSEGGPHASRIAHVEDPAMSSTRIGRPGGICGQRTYARRRTEHAGGDDVSINLKGASAGDRARYAALVRPARLRLGMSQLELATIAGVDRTTVSNVERGAVAPQPDVLRRMLGALGIATDEASDDLELTLWVAMIESLLLSLPDDARAAAADDAIAALAHHVRETGSSEAAASIPRTEPMQRQHAALPIAAKRGTPRRDEGHAD
jgi:transcriptional regulator with XRE-family HTH domain